MKNISLTRKARSSIGVLWFQTATVPSQNPGLQGRKLPLREILINRWIYGYPVSIHIQISSHKQTLKNQRAGDSSAFCLPYCAQRGDYSLVLGGNKDIAKNGSKSRVSATNICGVLGSLWITNEHLMIGSSDQDASEWNTLKGRESSSVHDFPMISLFRTAHCYVRMSTYFLIMTFSPGYQLH